MSGCAFTANSIDLSTILNSPATMTKDSIEKFGTSVPMGRAGQPIEIATAFVYLASPDSSYIR